MSGSMDCPIKILIDETSDAFSKYDYGVNADYAAFASMAIDEFKLAMAQPDMTAQQLRRLLRAGHREHQLISAPRSSWSSFMARYVTQNANLNTRAEAQGTELPEEA